MTPLQPEIVRIVEAERDRQRSAQAICEPWPRGAGDGAGAPTGGWPRCSAPSGARSGAMSTRRRLRPGARPWDRARASQAGQPGGSVHDRPRFGGQALAQLRRLEHLGDRAQAEQAVVRLVRPLGPEPQADPAVWIGSLERLGGRGRRRAEDVGDEAFVSRLDAQPVCDPSHGLLIRSGGLPPERGEVEVFAPLEALARHAPRS